MLRTNKGGSHGTVPAMTSGRKEGEPKRGPGFGCLVMLLVPCLVTYLLVFQTPLARRLRVADARLEADLRVALERRTATLSDRLGDLRGVTIEDKLVGTPRRSSRLRGAYDLPHATIVVLGVVQGSKRAIRFRVRGALDPMGDEADAKWDLEEPEFLGLK